MGTRYTMEGAVPKGQAVDPEGSQPRYTRGSANDQTSPDLIAHQQCVAQAMEGESGNRGDIRDAFEKASKDCA